MNAVADTAPTQEGLDRRGWLALVIVAGAYVAAARLGFSLAFATRQVTAVWPPTGIAVAALLLRGFSLWPGILVGALVANLTAGTPPVAAIGIAIGNTIGPLVGVSLMRRLAGFDSRLERSRDVLALALIGSLLAMTITATNGVGNLVLAGVVPRSAYFAVWWVWWAGDAMGVLLVAPVLLCWLQPRTDFRSRDTAGRGGELCALVLALTAASYLSFNSDVPLAYAVFPPVIWAALRFGQRGGTSAVAYVSAVAIWATIHNRGPFISGNFDQSLILLVTFMAVVAITALLLGAATMEREQAEASLQQAHRQLELRVHERTAELAAANQRLTETNATLSQRTSQLASKNEEVEAFVYIVSHDLRAPLVNLQGFAKELELNCGDLEKTLADTALPPATSAAIRTIFDEGIHGALRFIGASVDKFERLIGALLMLSRTGQQSYRSEPVDVRAVVAASLNELHQTVVASGASIDIGELPQASGDATAIGQVFANLLGNALKYLQPGRTGHIEVGGEVREGVAHYWVRDNGAGIPASAMRRLFQVFQRFHPELAPGEGIGLAAVKRIVERHGGRISADSEPGCRFDFPRQPAGRDPGRPVIMMTSHEHVTIVIVDDDHGHCELVRRNLRRVGVNNPIRMIHNANEALDFVFRRGAHQERTGGNDLLILLDINMPGGMNGLDVLREIKSHPETRKVPVIMLTTTDDPKEVNRCYELGCSVYITKPVSPKAFVESVGRLGMFIEVVSLPSGDGPESPA